MGEWKLVHGCMEACCLILTHINDYSGTFHPSTYNAYPSIHSLQTSIHPFNFIQISVHPSNPIQTSVHPSNPNQTSVHQTPFKHLYIHQTPLKHLCIKLHSDICTSNPIQISIHLTLYPSNHQTFRIIPVSIQRISVSMSVPTRSVCRAGQSFLKPSLACRLAPWPPWDREMDWRVSSHTAPG